MIDRARALQFKNATLAIIIFIYYLSLLMFIITLVILPFLPQYTNYTGALAFVFLIGFIMAGMLSHQYLIDGSEVSVYKQVLGYKDNSVILLSLFTLFRADKDHILPSIYSDDFRKHISNW
jgi:glucan phosphoethanolaminetransferase (alkaline phosphatase superfamily)